MYNVDTTVLKQIKFESDNGYSFSTTLKGNAKNFTATIRPTKIVHDGAFHLSSLYTASLYLETASIDDLIHFLQCIKEEVSNSTQQDG